MVEILVEVGDGSACIRMAARAESVRRAVGLAGAFSPGPDVRVGYPIYLERFFVRNFAAPTGLVRFEMLAG